MYDMLFPIKHLQETDPHYPGVLTLIEKNPNNNLLCASNDGNIPSPHRKKPRAENDEIKGDDRLRLKLPTIYQTLRP